MTENEQVGMTFHDRCARQAEKLEEYREFLDEQKEAIHLVLEKIGMARADEDAFVLGLLDGDKEAKSSLLAK